MKICGIICEFNPFHNGHAHILKEALKLSGCDALLCIMSGSFSQRGELCISDKTDRARHAVLNGADCVIELPVSFSVAPAEIFAGGAVKILSSVKDVTTLAFGCENPEADFVSAAKILLKEPPPFKEVLAENLEKGESFIKSRAKAFAACGGDENLLLSPNNILGVEYAAAVIRLKSHIGILPIKREGSPYLCEKLDGEFPSSAAIRKNIADPAVKSAVPACVYEDLRDFGAETKEYERLMRFCLIGSSPQNLKRIFGCTEGLENKLRESALMPFGELVSSVAGKRYTHSRIRRIMLANMLGLYSDDCGEYLQSTLYIKPLAVKKERADEMLAALAKSDFPTVMKLKDMQNLCAAAQKCLKSDLKAYKIANFIFGRQKDDFSYPIFI